MLLINRPKRNACEPSKEGKGWTIFFYYFTYSLEE